MVFVYGSVALGGKDLAVCKTNTETKSQSNSRQDQRHKPPFPIDNCTVLTNVCQETGYKTDTCVRNDTLGVRIIPLLPAIG